MTYWSSRKNAEFVVCEVPVVKKQHTSTEEQTLTQHLPVCWLSLYLCFCHFPSLRLLHLRQRSLSPSQREVHSCSVVTCGWWPGKTVPLPVRVVQWQPRFLRDGRQTEQHSGGDVCVEPVFMWMVTLFYSQYFLQDETYTWGLQITAQTDESSVELVLTSWVWHDKSLI